MLRLSRTVIPLWAKQVGELFVIWLIFFTHSYLIQKVDSSPTCFLRSKTSNDHCVFRSRFLLIPDASRIRSSCFVSFSFPFSINKRRRWQQRGSNPWPPNLIHDLLDHRTTVPGYPVNILYFQSIFSSSCGISSLFIGLSFLFGYKS